MHYALNNHNSLIKHNTKTIHVQMKVQRGIIYHIYVLMNGVGANAPLVWGMSLLMKTYGCPTRENPISINVMESCCGRVVNRRETPPSANSLSLYVGDVLKNNTLIPQNVKQYITCNEHTVCGPLFCLVIVVFFRCVFMWFSYHFPPGLLHWQRMIAQWVSCQIRKIAGAHAPGTFSPSPQVIDPDMHHGTCVTHVPWCMPESLTCGFLWNR